MKLSNFVPIFLIFVCISSTGFFKSDHEFQSCFFENFDIESDAAVGIQNILNNGEKPYFIERTYEISNEKVVVKTKTHFSEYRKRPFYQEDVFNTSFVNSSDIDVEVKFIYKKSDKKHLTRINKKAKKSKRESKIIAFNHQISTSSPIRRV